METAHDRENMIGVTLQNNCGQFSFCFPPTQFKGAASSCKSEDKGLQNVLFYLLTVNTNYTEVSKLMQLIKLHVAPLISQMCLN